VAVNLSDDVFAAWKDFGVSCQQAADALIQLGRKWRAWFGRCGHKKLFGRPCNALMCEHDNAGRYCLLSDKP